MDSNRIARQVMDWTLPHFRRKRGRTRVSWTSTVKKDLELLGLTWDEALDLTLGMERLYCPMCFYSTRKD